MKRFLSLLLTLILFLSFTGCEENTEETAATGILKDGIYFITEDSLNDLELSGSTVVSKDAWVIVNNGTATLCFFDAGRFSLDQYKLTASESRCVGTMPGYTIEMWLVGTELHLLRFNKEYVFEYDSSYAMPDTGVKLAPLHNNADILRNSDNLTLMWNYDAKYGYVGAVIEIKRAGESSYTEYKVEKTYMNSIVVQLYFEKFPQGDSYVRIKNSGYTYLSNQGVIIENLDSDYLELKLSVNGDDVNIVFVE